MRIALRNGFLMVAGVAIAAGGTFLPMRAGIAESGAPVKALPVLMTGAMVGDPRIADDPALLADENVTFSRSPVEFDVPQQPAVAETTASDARELECMAKVVRHEAGNQPRRGQLAVAQIMMNRARSGKFPKTLCAVANQPGQFFDIASYNPRRDTPEWQTAMEVSQEAMTGSADDVTNGAVFYHAAYQAPTRFFRSRQRVQTLGDHIFYR